MSTTKNKPSHGSFDAKRRPWLAVVTLFLGVLVSAYLSLQLYSDAGAPLKYRVLRLGRAGDLHGRARLRVRRAVARPAPETGTLKNLLRAALSW